MGRQAESRRGRRWLAVLGVLAVLAVMAVPASAADYETTPLLNVGLSNHELAHPALLYLDAFHLDAVPETERVVFQTAPGFAVALPTKIFASLGEAYLDAVPPGGSTDDTEFDGSLIVMDPAAYAASAVAQACAPGAHTATWDMQMTTTANQPLELPVAVDAVGDGSYKLTICVDPLRALKLVTAELYVDIDGVVTNTTTAGRYVFSAVVTPYGTDGLPSADNAYEMRSYEDMPQSLTASAKYTVATKTFLVTGVLQANGAPRVGINVHIYAGQFPTDASMREVGYAVTDSSGRYTFTRRMAAAPRYAYGWVNHYWAPDCLGSTAPPAATAGCVSHTTDGRGSALLVVKVVKPKPKKPKKPAPKK